MSRARSSLARRSPSDTATMEKITSRPRFRSKSNSNNSDLFHGECARMHFFLSEALLELLAIARPPLAIERLDDDFDHDDPVAFDHLVLVAFPQACRGAAAGIRGHTAE